MTSSRKSEFAWATVRHAVGLPLLIAEAARNPRVIFHVALVSACFILPANAQDNRAVSVPSTNVLPWSTMGYTNFMAGHPDEAKRRELWKCFLIVEREAKGFAGSSKHWETLKTVKLGPAGPMWYSGGTLELNATSDCGAMFHEIFHNTFNGSQLSKGGDNAWSEAFCDAFRYMMEKKFLPKPRTSWFLHLDSFTSETYAQVMAKSGDKHFDQTYFYPASLVIRRAAKDPERFRVLWFELQKVRRAKNADVLNAYFGYDMQHGRPMGLR
jgi:hypothetical protein